MKTFRTGDLVKTVGNWEGWITLGVAYTYEDWLATSKQIDTSANRRYIYVQAITGKILEQNDINDGEIGGYYPENVEILSKME